VSDEDAQREQAERWREEIEAAKAGQPRPASSPREFTDPHRPKPAPQVDRDADDVSEEDEPTED
jgi:hypothetical protein